jgi:hypothetical protein
VSDVTGTSDLGFKAFASVDFDWAVRLQDIWQTPAYDIPEIHRDARDNLIAEGGRLESLPTATALGWFCVGGGGVGKTHLLTMMRAEASSRGWGFVLVDMTDVRDFWETTAQGYLASLQSPYATDDPQYLVLLRKFVGLLSSADKIAANVEKLTNHRSTILKKDIDNILGALARKFPAPTLAYQDAVRSLVCLNSTDFSLANAGSTWLQALEIDEEIAKELAFQRRKTEPREIVRALSWLMSLAGPTVLAFDQLDPIVHQLARQCEVNDVEEQNTSRWIIDQIGNGLAALRDTTTRTLTIVACLEGSYQILKGEVLAQTLDRFNPAIRLKAPQLAHYEPLIANRLAGAYRKAGFAPPYPTWPFRPEAVSAFKEQTPREVLQLCEAHRRKCLAAGKVEELSAFAGPGPVPPPPPADSLEPLDRKFAELCSQADVPSLADERQEDDVLAPIYQSALRCLLREGEDRIPPRIDASVDTAFSGAKTTKPLHARVRIVHHDDNGREEHYCVRVLLKANAQAFKARLKAAITQSGIDRKLSFRRLTIVRTPPSLPGGKVTGELVSEFNRLGGTFHNPADDELRILSALARMEELRAPLFVEWLKSRTPLAKLRFGEAFMPRSLFNSSTATPETNATASHSAPNGSDPPQTAPAPPRPAAEFRSTTPVSPPTLNRDEPKVPIPPARPTSAVPTIPFGRRILGADKLGDQVGVPADVLAKHTVILAGSGSGKTVLVRRLIEEAALAGIPSIVIDVANDIATFDEPRTSSPHWQEGDPERAARFREASEMVLWTPGKESGNPLALQPLPDFAAVKNDPEELDAAVTMAQGSLQDIVATGSGVKAQNKVGILATSLRFLAQQYESPTLQDYVDLLEDLPPEASLGLGGEQKLAKEMADAIKIQLSTNPLLRPGGTPLDPALLFGDDAQRSRTRISVISLAWLTTLDAQRSFLNQLAMVLFSWIKKIPNPPGRSLRGLLVIDEAKDFVPSLARSACKESVLRLGAQARKYGLGLVFATQHPKDIEHKLVGNCATHLYGLNNSPASIETLKELMRQKGGTGDDIARLKTGQFYFHSAGMGSTQPVKIKVPDCLSEKREKPMEESEILWKATESRRRLS